MDSRALLSWLLLGAGIAGGLGGSEASAQRQIFPLVTAADTAPVTSRFVDLAPPIGISNSDVVAIADPGGIALSDGRSVVSYGDVVPGFGRLIAFGSPVINVAGDVAFTGGSGVQLYHSFMSGFGLVPRKTGLLLASGGQIQVVAVAGEPSPDGTPFTESLEFDPSSHSISDSGWIAFLALTGRGTGLFLYADGALEKLAGEGDPAPDGGTYQLVGRSPFSVRIRPALSNAGEVAFVAHTTIGDALFAVSRGGTGRVVARRGDALPGGTHVDIFAPPNYAANLGIDGAGDVLFFGAPFFVYPGPLDGGLYLSSGGQLQKVVADGDPAPGGGTFASVAGSPDACLALNNHGDASFFAIANNVPGIYSWSGGTIRRIVQRGDPAPGGGSFTEVAASETDGRQSLSDGGTIAFTGRVFNFPQTGNTAFRAGSDGTLSLVARRGDPSPNRPAYRSFSVGTNGINASGTVAFRAGVAGGGIFLADGSGVHVVASVDDPAPGGGRFVDFLRAPTINRQGDVSFVATIYDGSLPAPTALFAGPLGSLRRVVEEGDPAARGQFSCTNCPFVDDTGGPYSSAFDRPFIDDAGQLTFLATVVRSASSKQKGGLFRTTDTGVVLLSSRRIVSIDVDGAGDIVGAVRGNRFGRVVLFVGRTHKTFRTTAGQNGSYPVLNDGRAIAFVPPDGIVFRAADGAMTNVVARPYQPGVNPAVDLNDLGDVLYGYDDGGPGAGFFRWRQGATQAVALVGDTTSVGAISYFDTAIINDTPEVVFTGAADDGTGDLPAMFTTMP